MLHVVVMLNRLSTQRPFSPETKDLDVTSPTRIDWTAESTWNLANWRNGQQCFKQITFYRNIVCSIIWSPVNVLHCVDDSFVPSFVHSTSFIHSFHFTSSAPITNHDHRCIKTVHEIELNIKTLKDRLKVSFQQRSERDGINSVTDVCRQCVSRRRSSVRENSFPELSTLLKQISSQSIIMRLLSSVGAFYMKKFNVHPFFLTYTIMGLLTAKPMLGRSLFLLRNRFLALVLPNLNRSG